jgi:WD40 repeat protein
MRLLQGHTDWVQALAYAPDGSTLASAGDDCTVRLWSAGTGEPRTVLQGHTDVVLCLAFLGGSSSLVSCGFDRQVCAWDLVGSGRREELMTMRAAAVALAVSPSGRYVGAGTDFGRGGHGSLSSLQVYDREEQAILRRNWFTDVIPAVWALGFSPDGRTLAAGVPRGGRVFLWHFPEGRERLQLSNPYAVHNLVFSPDGATLAVLTGPEVRLWDVQTGLLRGVLGGEGYPVWSAAFSPDGGLLVAGGRDGTVRVWDVRATAEIWRFDWGLGRINAVAVAPDGLTAAAAGMSREILVWDLDG